MLDSAIKEQLKGLFAQLDAHYTFDIFVHPRHESRAEPYPAGMNLLLC